MQRLAKVVLQLFVPLPLKQHKPDPFGVDPIGHEPFNAGVVHVPPALGRPQL
jgi:hypothetical protein